MSKKEIISLLAIYLLISLGIFLVTSLGKRRFSEDTLRQLMSGSGKSKQLTTDPCDFSVAGDPNAGNNFIRLIVHCSNGKRSISTFDATAIRGGTLEAVLAEFHRINGVSAESKAYKCARDSAPITLISTLSPPTTLECTYEN